MTATTRLLKNLQLLQKLVQREEERDEVIEATVSKLVSYELEKLKERRSRIREKLTAFEKRYSMETEEFCRSFREGGLGDEMDFFEWSALADMYEEISQQLVEAERVSDVSPNPGTTQ